MALSLNTSHPLYGNLLALICVDDDDTVKDLKGNQTCTKDAACSTGSGGAYGRYFRTTLPSGNARGVSMSPGVVLGSGAKSVFIVTNAINSVAGSRYMALHIMTVSGWSPSVSGSYVPRIYSADNGAALAGSAAINSGGHSWGAAADRTGNLSKTFADGSVLANGNANNSGYGSSSAQTYIGGEYSGGYGGIAADYVWVAFFDKYLSDAEIAALHSSLGANNAFALVGAAATNVIASNAAQSNTVSSGAILSVLTGTLTTAPLKNNAGALLANETGATAFVHNVATGALVVMKTGQTTNAAGVMTINDAAIVPGTTYRVVVKLASTAEGLDKLTAT